MCQSPFLGFTQSKVVPDDAFGKHKNTEPDDIEETKWDESEDVRMLLLSVLRRYIHMRSGDNSRSLP